MLPSQLGRHFWPDFAFISGVRVDYFSPTLYLTDILVFVLFLLAFKKLFKWFSGKRLIIFGVIALVAILNIATSLSPFVSIYKWLKVLELAFLVWWIYQSNIKIRTITLLLVIPVFFESALSFLQFWKIGSLGGVFWLFGERSFNSITPGVANTSFDGQLVLRPYGTFSHPNVLGGFLAITLPLILYYFPHKFRKITAGVLAFGLSTLFLTMSRAAISVGLTQIAIVLYLKSGKKLIFLVCLAIIIGLLSMCLPSRLESLEVRGQLSVLAEENFVRSPILGTGLGTSPLYKNPEIRIKNYALSYQPTHSIYLMSLGETGVLGLIGLVAVFGLAIYRVWRHKEWVFVASLVSILFLGMVDHYFFTLQQGQLLVALILGLAFARIRE